MYHIYNLLTLYRIFTVQKRKKAEGIKDGSYESIYFPKTWEAKELLEKEPYSPSAYQT